VEVRRLTVLTERFICLRENLVFDSVIYLDPVERFKNRSNVMKFRNFGDSTSSRVEDKLKTIILSCRVKQQTCELESNDPLSSWFNSWQLNTSFVIHFQSESNSSISNTYYIIESHLTK